MPRVAFIGYELPASLQELARVLAHELGRQGIPSSSGGTFPKLEPDLVYALIDARSYVSTGRRPSAAELRRTVVVGRERAHAAFDGELLGLLRSAAAAFEVDPRTVGSLRRLGVDARELRPGYSQFRDRSEDDVTRSIDVLSLGAGVPRRDACLQELEATLVRRGRVVRRVDDSTDQSPSSREALLTQTKVLVIVHPDRTTSFDSLLAVDAIHAGAVVVAEHASGLGVLEPGRHLVVGATGALPYVIDGLLDDPARLDQLRQDARDRLRAWSPFAMSTAQFRGALVDAVGAPT